jgi:hypothetical protein
MNISDIFKKTIRVEDAPQIVPIESHDGFVGAEFIERLAERLKGDYTRKADIGLTDDFDEYRRPEPNGFDPSSVHPRIREFYEHTTRFKMNVTPRWNPLILPAFWVFKNFYAKNVGQFNLPIDDVEAGRGFESHIDTIDVDHDKKADVRAWIRTYPNSDDVVYVGIYSTLKLDMPYISVGFALPEANVTAVLVPHNVDGDGFLLTSARGDSNFGGEYFTLIDDDDGNRSTRERVRCTRITFHKEEIHVFVQDGKLLCRHRFYLFGLKFLTLNYDLEKKEYAPPKANLKELVKKAPSVTRRKPRWNR